MMQMRHNKNLMTDDTPVFDKTQTAERFKDFKIE